MDGREAPHVMCCTRARALCGRAEGKEAIKVTRTVTSKVRCRALPIRFDIRRCAGCTLCRPLCEQQVRLVLQAVSCFSHLALLACTCYNVARILCLGPWGCAARDCCAVAAAMQRQWSVGFSLCRRPVGMLLVVLCLVVLVGRAVSVGFTRHAAARRLRVQAGNVQGLMVAT